MARQPLRPGRGLYRTGASPAGGDFFRSFARQYADETTSSQGREGLGELEVYSSRVFPLLTPLAHYVHALIQAAKERKKSASHGLLDTWRCPLPHSGAVPSMSLPVPARPPAAKTPSPSRAACRSPSPARCGPGAVVRNDLRHQGRRLQCERPPRPCRSIPGGRPSLLRPGTVRLNRLSTSVIRGRSIRDCVGIPRWANLVHNAWRATGESAEDRARVVGIVPSPGEASRRVRLPRRVR